MIVASINMFALNANVFLIIDEKPLVRHSIRVNKLSDFLVAEAYKSQDFDIILGGNQKYVHKIKLDIEKEEILKFGKNRINIEIKETK